MADNVSITPGTGVTVATDEVTDSVLGTVQVQMTKLMDATLGSTNKLAVSVIGNAQIEDTILRQLTELQYLEIESARLNELSMEGGHYGYENH